MNRSPIDLRSAIAQGWTVMFLLFVSILFFELSQGVINDELSMFRSEAGRRAWRVAVLLIAVHASTPMLVCLVDGRRFRWALFGVTLVQTLALIVHQVVHLVNGEKPFDAFQCLDALHHALGIAVSVLAWRWARDGQAAMAHPPRLASGQAAA